MRNKFIFIFLIFLIFNSIFLIPTALAADSSPSADIKEKLKVLQDEIASRAANIKNEVSKKLLNKAYNGIIKTKDPTKLTISLKSGTGNININEFTEYIIKSKSLVGDQGLKNLSVSDPIVALGDVDDQGVLTAKRIIKLSKPQFAKKVIHGALISVSKDSAVLKTIQGDQFSIIFDKNTDYQLGKSDSSFSDIKVNRWIIAVTEETDSQTQLAKFVYIFPSSAIFKVKVSSDSSVQK